MKFFIVWFDLITNEVVFFLADLNYPWNVDFIFWYSKFVSSSASVCYVFIGSKWMLFELAWGPYLSVFDPLLKLTNFSVWNPFDTWGRCNSGGFLGL